MNFFFDRCMSPRLCGMMAILEDGVHGFTHHDVRFHQTTTDVEWIAAISQDNSKSIAISGDCKMLKRPDEVAAIQKSGLTFFIMADRWSSTLIYDQAWQFFKVWPEIVKASAVKEPTVFQVRGGSTLKVEKFSLTKHIRG